MKLKRGINNHLVNGLIVALCVLLFSVPFWSSGYYSVGGDDTRLFYIYPIEYLRNFLFEVMSGNSLGGNVGYYPVSHIAPLAIIILFLKSISPYVNTQQILYGANLLIGFLSMYIFLTSWSIRKTWATAFISILASLLYCTSPYLAKTLYSHELTSLYVVSLAPLLLLLLTHGIRKNDVRFAFVSAIIFSLYSSSLLSIPWLLPIGIVLTPYFVHLIIQYRHRAIILFAAFIALSIFLNAYWMIHGIVGILSAKNDSTLLSVITSQALIVDTEQVIKSMIYLNPAYHSIVGYLRTSWSETFALPLLSLIGSIPSLLISIGAFIHSKAQKQSYPVFFSIVLSFLIALLCITPSMGEWNLKLFLLANQYIPLFTMFRNMQDKFGPAMALVVSFGTALSLFIVLEQEKLKKIAIIGSIGVGILLCFQVPLFLRVQKIVNGQGFTTFSHDYQELIQFIQTHPTAKRYLWFPMTFTGYTYIPDAIEPSSYYNGLSPIQILTGQSDLVGFYGLGTPTKPERHWELLELLRRRQYDEYIHILASYNVGYVIVDRQDLPKEIEATSNQLSFIDLQTEEYRNLLLGEKIIDIGSSYSIYTLSSTFVRDTLFLTDDIVHTRSTWNPLDWRKIQKNTYQVTVPTQTQDQFLVLLAPYHSLWTLETNKTDNQKGENAPYIAYQYGNAWKISANSTPATFVVRFLPDKFTTFGIAISAITFVFSIVYIVWPQKRKKL